MLAIVMLTLLIGMGIGAVVTLAVEIAWGAVARRLRVTLDIRPDRRPYVPPESVGVVVRGRTPMGEPPSFLPDVQAFDEEHTQ